MANSSKSTSKMIPAAVTIEMRAIHCLSMCIGAPFCDHCRLAALRAYQSALIALPCSLNAPMAVHPARVRPIIDLLPEVSNAAGGADQLPAVPADVVVYPSQKCYRA